eukprot:gene5233-3747_t
MSRQKEYINTAGLRLDGRRPHETRPVRIQFNCSSAADGSCVLEAGNSKVYATVFGPQTGDARQSKPDEATITCDVAIAACASDRRRNPQRRNRHCDEIATTVVQVARSLVLLPQYPNSLIHINIEILRLDGDEKTLCLNAACLALANARVAMRDVLCAFTVGVLENQVVVDLTAEEIRSECPLLSVAFAGHNKENMLWFEAVARLAPEMLKKMMERAQECSIALFNDVERALREEAGGQN